MADGVMDAGEARDKRRAGGDERVGGDAGGPAPGPSGFSRRGAVRAFLVTATFFLLVDVMNVFTALHDAAKEGVDLPAWEPVTWEASSGLSMLLACSLVYAALVRAMPGRTSWPVLIAVHLTASLGFSILHIVLMNAMRVAIYAAVGHHYPFGASGFLYEYRKDLVAYVVIAGIFWLFARAEPAVPRAAAAAPRRSFDIIDGSRVLRTPLDEIAALRAAGNYVEFLLRDGGRPLMRASLGEIEAALAPSGFVRVHRSWIVNIALVRALRPAGSGDFTVALEGGIEAPVSRRFPGALMRLRAD